MSAPGEVLRLSSERFSAPPRGAPDLTFTDFVRRLEPGEQPRAELFEVLLQRLRGAVVMQLKRRSLWHLRPRCLGVFGYASWQDQGAVEELVAACHCFVFVERVGSLRVQASVRSEIDGLVFRSISNFFYDLQKKHDPLGFRLFSVLQLAVRQCCDDGRLHVWLGDTRVRNDTILGFRAAEGSRADGAETSRPPTPWPDELDSRIESLIDELLPELLTARGRTLEQLVRRLSGHVERLRETGLDSFAFGRLLERLKAKTRRRWSAIQGLDEEDRLSSWRPHGFDFEERQAFEQLVRCVDLRIERTPQNGKRAISRWQRLRRLWIFLRQQASEHPDSAELSGRRLSALLGIPRDSLPDLLALIGEWVEACQSGLSRSRGR